MSEPTYTAEELRRLGFLPPGEAQELRERLEFAQAQASNVEFAAALTEAKDGEWNAERKALQARVDQAEARVRSLTGEVDSLRAALAEQHRQHQEEAKALLVRAEEIERLVQLAGEQVSWWRRMITSWAAHLRRHDPKSPAGPGSRYSAEWLEKLLADPGGGTPSPSDRSVTLLDSIARSSAPVRELPPPEAMHGAADGFGGSDFPSIEVDHYLRGPLGPWAPAPVLSTDNPAPGTGQPLTCKRCGKPFVWKAGRAGGAPTLTLGSGGIYHPDGDPDCRPPCMVVRGTGVLPPTASLPTSCSACGEVLPPGVGHVAARWVEGPGEVVDPAPPGPPVPPKPPPGNKVG
jgi:hypothetical protein